MGVEPTSSVSETDARSTERRGQIAQGFQARAGIVSNRQTRHAPEAITAVNRPEPREGIKPSTSASVARRSVH